VKEEDAGGRVLLHLHIQREKRVLRGSRAGRRIGCRNVGEEDSGEQVVFITGTMRYDEPTGVPVRTCAENIPLRVPLCVCLLLQDLVQSCLRGGGGIWEDMCYTTRFLTGVSTEV
jgi:hypothetical protein